MTTQIQSEDEAKRIWEQLDAEYSGASAPAPAPAQDEPVQSNAAADKAAVEDASAKDQAPAPAVHDDIQSYRDKIAGLETMVQQLSGRVRNAEGHIGGLSSQLKQQIQAAQAVQAACMQRFGQKHPEEKGGGDNGGDYHGEYLKPRAEMAARPRIAIPATHQGAKLSSTWAEA